MSVEIKKLRTNFEVRFNFIRPYFHFNKSLSEFIKSLPKDQQQTKMDSIRKEDGTIFQDWYRVVNEAALAKIIDFIKSNNLRFKFTNMEVEDVEKLKKEFTKRQTRGEEALKAKAKDLDVSGLVIPNMVIQPYEYQKQAVVFFEKADGKCILGDQPGVGKSQNLDALIATPEGWSKMKDIKLGQQIFNHNGNIYPVTGIFPQGQQNTYKITFNDGFSAECNMEHLWMVRDVNRRKRGTGWIVKTLKELVDSGLKYNCSENRIKSGRKPVLKWEIPITQPLKYPTKNFIIDPYIMGGLLGDGHISGKNVCISIPNFQIEIKDHIEFLLPTNLKMRINEYPDCPQYYITQDWGNQTKRNPFKVEIEKLNISVKSGQKFIPREYMYSDINQRLAILQGLMDTDGSALKNRIHFHSSSKQLSEDVAELVQSLGGQAIICIYDRSKENKSTEYRVNVRLNMCPFRLKAKVKEWKIAKRNYASRYIESVDFIKEEEHQCISVDSPDHTYITNHYIVTHNTLSAISYAVKNKLKTLVVCPASLKLNWRNEIQKFSNEKAFIYKYKPKKNSKEVLNIKDDCLFHIINYEALETFVKLSVSHRCSYNNCGWKEVNIKKKYEECPSCSHKKTVKSRVLGTVFASKDGVSLEPDSYDLIVCDEAHYLKNAKANRTKVVKKGFAGVSKKLLLTGTAIKSVPFEFFSLLNFIDPAEWKNAHQFGVKYCAGFQDDFGWDYSGSSNLDELYSRISSYFLRRLKSDVLSFLPPKTFTHIPIELTPEEYKEYSQIEKKVVDESEESTNDADHLSRIQKLKMFTSHVKALRGIELVQDIIAGGEKVVVFTEYLSTADKIKNHFGDNAVLFTGQKSAIEKQEAVDKFMKDDSVKVFVGTIGAAGVGITLTVSSIAVFIDQPWTPSDREQAEDRIHRASTTSDKVQIIRLICQDTFDEDIISLLNHKEKITSLVLDAAILDRKVQRLQGSIFKDLIALILDKKNVKNK